MPRIRPDGGLSGVLNSSTIAGGSGMWTMRDHERNLRTSTWPSDTGNADSYFNRVVALIHADSTNNDTTTTFVDSSADKIPFTGTYSTYFNGTTDKITAPTSANLSMSTGDFTVECWVYWFGNTTPYQNFVGSNSAAFTGNATFFRVWGSATSQTQLRNKIGIGNPTHDALSAVYSTNSLTVNTWNHVAVTRSSGIIRVFLNGNLEATGTTDNSVYDFGDNGLCMGASPWDGANGWFGGYISNLRIIKGSALYTSSFTPPSSVLTAVSGTQFLSCRSSTIIDVSANAFTLTSTGTPAASNGNYPLALTRTGTTTQGTFSPYSQPSGSWSNYFESTSLLSFPANSNYLIGTQNFTIECWAFVAVSGVIQGLVCSHQTGGMFQFYVTASRTILAAVNVDGGATSGYTNLTSAGTITIGTWNHLALVRNGTEVAIFINGVKDTNTATLSAGTNIGSFGGNKAIYVGSTADQGNKITGYISNVRYVLGSAVYGSNFTPPGPLTAITGTQLLTCQDNRFRDNSINGIIPTLVGAPQVSAYSPFAPTASYLASTNGGSYYNNGSSGYSRIALAQNMFGFGTGDFTVECWVYFTAVSTGTVIDFRTNGGAGSQVKPTLYMISTGVFGFYTSSTGRITTTVTTGQWYHIAAVRSSSVTKMFVNGVAVATTYADTNDYGSSNQFTIGASADTLSGQFVSGHISDVRVAKSAIYSSNFTPPTSPLTAITGTQLLMNFTNGKIIDQSRNINLATVGSSKVSTTQSKFGGSSVLLNGTTDYLAITSTNAATANPSALQLHTSDFTVEGWFYLNALPASTATLFILNGNASSFGGIRLDVLPAGTMQLLMSTTGAAWAINYTTPTGSGNVLNTNQWYHIALVRSGSSFYIFVDGLQKGVTQTNTGSCYAGSGYNLIGAILSTTYQSFLSAYVDEFRITKYARYTANFTPPTQAFLDR